MATEISSYEKYKELSPSVLMARCREVLSRNTRLAIAELANHLPAERQIEFRMPDNPASVRVIVTSPDKKRFFRITYFGQQAVVPQDVDALTLSHRKKIVIEEVERFGQHQFRPLDPGALMIGEWVASSSTTESSPSGAIWERLEEKGSQNQPKVFHQTRRSIYEESRLIQGDPLLLPVAAEALTNAFEITGQKVKSLDFIEQVSWNTRSGPKKPEPPTGGGHRVRQPIAILTPIIETKGKRL